MEIKHLSKSAVCQILEACGHSYYLEKVLGIKTAPSVGPIVGQTLHKAQEFYFRRVLEGKAPEKLEVLKIAQEQFDKMFSAADLKYGNLFKKFGQFDTPDGFVPIYCWFFADLPICYKIILFHFLISH